MYVDEILLVKMWVDFVVLKIMSLDWILRWIFVNLELGVWSWLIVFTY